MKVYSNKGKTYEQIVGKDKAIKWRGNLSKVKKDKKFSKGHCEKVRIGIRKSFEKGRIIWNKGLTKESCDGVRKYADKLRGKRKSDSHLRNWMKANKKKPNRKELELGSLLQKWLFKEYKYVGDGQFILGGLCPDFLNVNGQKKVIEMFGDYWHREEDVQKRIGRFKEYGYNCLVVWERELKDISLVKKKVLKFNGKRKGD